ncbi:PIG-L deacetylase family protein [Nocardioides yefusunii]|uniref:PIG-L deacetylase family protein n=1 Tax=Nocardioides yefusunii TaxID=2500546 RepID=A0ABW1QTL5_9ACTN|nr:PIG-L deacetylase family protein [Nocardioides yefusunii]
MTTETPALLPTFDDADVQRVLCVVAHPDDIEYGPSTAVATWTARGVEVRYLLMTRGEAGISTMHPDETGALRTREQIAAGVAVGVDHIDFLGHPDGMLTYSLDLRRDVARAVRTFRPDIVVTQTWAEEPAWGLNQGDHRATGLACADGVRDAGNRWVFTDLIDEGLEPWSPQWLLVHGDPNPTHGVVVDEESFERGVASLEAHAEYFAVLTDHPTPRELVTTFTTTAGAAMGVPHAMLFRVHAL